MTKSHILVRWLALSLAIAWCQTGRAQPKDPFEANPQADQHQGRLRHLEDLTRRAAKGRTQSFGPNLPAQFDFFVTEHKANPLGASFVSADESLRSQLGLPKEQGLVVESVAPGGPAARVGLVVNDVLTTLNDQPIATTADLIQKLKAAGEKEVPLKLLRSGKPVTIQVQPEYSVTFGPVGKAQTHYQLGVQVTSLDPTLRAQLKLPDQEGLLVNYVESDSGAAQAGIKKHDILLAVGDHPLKSPEDLVEQMKSSSGKAMRVKLLRKGEELTLEATPTLQTTRQIDQFETLLAPNFRAVRPFGPWTENWWNANPQFAPTPRGVRPFGGWNENRAPNLRRPEPSIPHGPSERQLGDLQSEVKELRQMIERLQKSLQEKSKSDRPE